jgi:hypothetical protein
MLFKCSYETLITSLIKGWMAKKPSGQIDGNMSFKEWNETKASVKEWIEYYHNIVVSMKSQYLQLIVYNTHFLPLRSGRSGVHNSSSTAG